MKVSNKSLHMKIRFYLNMYVLSSEKKSNQSIWIQMESPYMLQSFILVFITCNRGLSFIQTVFFFTVPPENLCGIYMVSIYM